MCLLIFTSLLILNVNQTLLVFLKNCCSVSPLGLSLIVSVTQTLPFMLNFCFFTSACSPTCNQLQSSKCGGSSSQWSTKTHLLSGEHVRVCVRIVTVCVYALCMCTPLQIVRQPGPSRGRVVCNPSTHGFKPQTKQQPTPSSKPQQAKRAFLWDD